LRPIDVNYSNAQKVRDNVYGEYLKEQKQRSLTKFQEGDKVRVAKQKTAFDKGYLPNYTDEVYEVNKVKQGKINAYDLKTTQGEEIQGKFYPQELSRTKYERNVKLTIEKVVKTRKRGRITEYFVKWKNRPHEENCWITNSDLLPKEQ